LIACEAELRAECGPKLELGTERERRELGTERERLELGTERERRELGTERGAS